MAEFPALPIFTDAFIADTLHLTAAQTGAYFMLLMCAWRTKDCCLPNDDNKLAAFARMDKRSWNTNRDIILAFWHIKDDGHLYQKRLRDERKYAEDRRNQAIQAGKASALKRKGRHSTDVITERQPKRNNPKPLPLPTNIKTNIGYEDLQISDIQEWLTEKHVAGKYLTVDEHELLEKFKDYCRSKNPKYNDYIAAFRNAFKWDNLPRKGKTNENTSRKPTYTERLETAGKAGLAKILADIDSRTEQDSGEESGEPLRIAQAEL